MKLCKDCKWCSHKEPTIWQKILYFGLLSSVWDKLEFAKCLHKSANTIKGKQDYTFYVTGIPSKVSITDFSYCGTMRAEYGACKPEGINWEPKE